MKPTIRVAKVGFLTHLQSCLQKRWYAFIDVVYAMLLRFVSVRGIIEVFILLQLLDGLLTAWAISIFGTDLEYNWIARDLFEQYGVWRTVVCVKLGIVGFTMSVLIIAFSGWIKRGRPRKTAVLGTFVGLLISTIPLFMWGVAYSILFSAPEMRATILETLREVVV